MNFWEGCTKVGPGCDFCYAEARDVRFTGGAHWGAGAPRRQMSLHTRNNPHRWQKKAAEFMAENGHHQRVFCSSLADIFDNEVPAEWRADAFATMEATPDLRWQLCTKRVSNIAKMVPEAWNKRVLEPGLMPLTMTRWPRNVGVLITTVTPDEVLRDVPRLLDLKRRFGIPWVGLSIEPMIADVAADLADVLSVYPPGTLDWAIFGGESGFGAREMRLEWMISGGHICRRFGVKVFNKQLGAKALDLNGRAITPSDKDPALKDATTWPTIWTTGDGGQLDTLRQFEFPAALN